MALSISAAISKYSQGDDAYALKLKENIRGAMGYSNYQAKLKGAVEAPINTGDVSKMDPATIAAHRNSVMGINQDQIDTYGKITSQIDSVAGSLAAAQAARDKAVANDKKMGLENGVAFQPKNQLQQDILSYMQNPKNEDGSVKSLQQFETEMNSKYGASDQVTKNNVGPDGELIARDILDSPSIKKEISSTVPADFIGQEDKYMLMSRGFSEKQAKENAGALRYQQMTPGEKMVYETQSPTMAKLLQQEASVADAIKDATAVREGQDANGKKITAPMFSYQQLKEKYPSVTDADLKQIAGPVYKQDANSAIEEELAKSKGTVTSRMNGWFDGLGDGDQIAQTDFLKYIYQGKDKSTTYVDGGFESIKKTPFYKELSTKLQNTYAGVLTAGEVENLIYNNLMSKIQ